MKTYTTNFKCSGLVIRSPCHASVTISATDEVIRYAVFISIQYAYMFWFENLRLLLNHKQTHRMFVILRCNLSTSTAAETMQVGCNGKTLIHLWPEVAWELPPPILFHKEINVVTVYRCLTAVPGPAAGQNFKLRGSDTVKIFCAVPSHRWVMYWLPEGERLKIQHLSV